MIRSDIRLRPGYSIYEASSIPSEFIMSTSVSRRDFLFLGSALAAGVLPVVAHAASPGSKRLLAETRLLDVNGKPARVFGLTGPNGMSGLRLVPGERFHVELANKTGGPAPWFIGTGSFRPGPRTGSHGRKPRRSKTAVFRLMTTNRSPAPIGCTRITGCRSNA
jgi:hypothetical protein